MGAYLAFLTGLTVGGYLVKTRYTAERLNHPNPDAEQLEKPVSARRLWPPTEAVEVGHNVCGCGHHQSYHGMGSWSCAKNGCECVMYIGDKPQKRKGNS